MIQLTATTSRLSQSGNNCQPFNLESLSIMEVEAFTATRIRALPGTGQSTLVDKELPLETGVCRGKNPVRLCLRPGEWLELSEPGQEGSHRFPKPHPKSGFYSWDETDGLAMLRVEGDSGPWLMRKNSGLDFQVNTETRSHCAQCKFGRSKALVFYRQRKDNTGQFNLLVDRSLVAYLWTLLISTAPHAVELQQKYGQTTDRARS